MKGEEECEGENLKLRIEVNLKVIFGVNSEISFKTFEVTRKATHGNLIGKLTIYDIIKAQVSELPLVMTMMVTTMKVEHDCKIW